MPYSDDSNVEYVEYFIGGLQPNHVLDVGAGAGKYGKIVRAKANPLELTALEPWEPYIDEFKLDDIYDNVFTIDIREANWDVSRKTISLGLYDLIIFGDVLEHMTKEDAIEVYGKAASHTTNIIISIPIVHYPQGHEHGNPYEEHIKDDWTTEEVLDTFEGIYDWKVYEQTATFLAGW